MTEINVKTRQGRMLDGLVRGGNRNAKVVVTVTLTRPDRATAIHQPIRFKAYDSRAGRNAGCRMVAADLMDGDWSEGTYATKVLEWNTDRDEELPGWNSRERYADQLIIYAARAAWKYLTTGEAPAPANGTVTVEEQALCGCCGRPLDREESVTLGVGPECARRVGLEHRYRSSRLARTRPGAPVRELSSALLGQLSMDADDRAAETA